jgi:hypothetical protein
VAYIEKGGFLARPVVGLGDAEVGVLDRHGVTAERDQLGAVLEVEVI